MDTPKKFSIFGFAGSLRKGSYNRAILRAALDVLPGNAALEIFDLEGIPPFNQDLEGSPPERVRAFKTGIRAADALLIACPEYNYSMSGVLKNAIDWASRPYGDSAFQGKPAAMMGASIGMIATARAQYHLRQSMVFLDMHPVNQPEVMVPFADKKIDGNGRLTDDPTREKIRELIVSLMAWTVRLKG
jgi:chromate reductase